MSCDAASGELQGMFPIWYTRKEAKKFVLQPKYHRAIFTAATCFHINRRTFFSIINVLTNYLIVILQSGKSNNQRNYLDQTSLELLHNMRVVWTHIRVTIFFEADLLNKATGMRRAFLKESVKLMEAQQYTHFIYFTQESTYSLMSMVFWFLTY